MSLKGIGEAPGESHCGWVGSKGGTQPLTSGKEVS